MAAAAGKFDFKMSKFNSDHFSTSFAWFRTMRDEQKLVDVVLNVNGKDFHCHRAVLAACSPYFHAMFTGNLSESRQEKIVLQDDTAAGVKVEVAAMEEVMHYAYSGEVRVTSDNVLQLYVAADLFQIDFILQHCVRYMEGQLDSSNCFGIFSFADMFGAQALRGKSLKYICSRFGEVSREEDFFQLSPSQLCDILASNDLAISDEMAVWSAVISWIMHAPNSRKDSLVDALTCIRLPLLRDSDIDWISEYITMSQLEQDVDGPMTSMDKAVEFWKEGQSCAQQRVGEAEEMIVIFKARQRLEPGVATAGQTDIEAEELACLTRDGRVYSTTKPCVDSILPLGVVSAHEWSIYIFAFPEASYPSFHKYDCVQNEWTQLASPPSRHDYKNPYIAQVGDKIYLFFSSGQTENMHCFDMRLREWRVLSVVPRVVFTDTKLAVVDKYIYAVSCEFLFRYNSIGEEWTKLWSLADSGVSVEKIRGVVGVRNTVYCLSQNALYAYSTDRNQWRQLDTTGVPGVTTTTSVDSGPHLVSLQGHLHLLVAYKGVAIVGYRFSEVENKWELALHIPCTYYIGTQFHCITAKLFASRLGTGEMFKDPLHEIDGT
ncbi:kelch repeat and BTB domain-containing protein 8-like [Branchiostoma floridae x Branchiostoma belcheri]